ncbi:transposase, partial [Corynebacterium diphtheriae]
MGRPGRVGAGAGEDPVHGTAGWRAGLGNWNTIYKNFNRWAAQGVWERVLEKTQSMAQQAGELDWV